LNDFSPKSQVNPIPVQYIGYNNLYLKEVNMGMVYAEITLKNAGDVDAVQRGHMKEDEVRSVVVKALVDTGAGTLVINEEISQKLGLKVNQVRQSTLADGSKHMYTRMESVSINWENRESTLRPTMIPGAEKVLLGAIPLQDMDLIVDPRNERLIGRHGETPVTRV
jgi:clan AA aspartic protease